MLARTVNNKARYKVSMRGYISVYILTISKSVIPVLLCVQKIMGLACEIIRQIRSVRVIETHLKPKHQLVSYRNPTGTWEHVCFSWWLSSWSSTFGTIFWNKTFRKLLTGNYRTCLLGFSIYRSNLSGVWSHLKNLSVYERCTEKYVKVHTGIRHINAVCVNAAQTPMGSSHFLCTWAMLRSKKDIILIVRT